MKSIPILLSALQLCLLSQSSTEECEQILEIMERLLVEAAQSRAESIQQYLQFASKGVSMEDVQVGTESKSYP